GTTRSTGTRRRRANRPSRAPHCSSGRGQLGIIGQLSTPTANGHLRIAVDIGGTFTDLTAFDSASGSVELGKALSTPSNLTEGIMAAMAKTGVSPAEAGLVIHGSTVVINAILQRRGART